MKVALAFWGLTRSLEKTFESIQSKIFDVFTKNNIEYVVFLHTYSLNRKFTNKRTGEKNCVINNTEYLRLKPQYSMIDNQEVVEGQIDFVKYRSHPDPWNTNYNSVDNFIIAMYSKLQLTKLIENSEQIFDYVIFLRPDVRYLNDFDIKWFSMVKETTLLIPNFHLYSNINDRFAIATLANAIHIGKIYEIMYDYSLKKPLHSETMLHYYATKILKLTIVYIPFRFNRVRANGFELRDAGSPIFAKTATPRNIVKSSPLAAKPATPRTMVKSSPVVEQAAMSRLVVISPSKPITGRRSELDLTIVHDSDNSSTPILVETLTLEI